MWYMVSCANTEFKFGICQDKHKQFWDNLIAEGSVNVYIHNV